MDAEKSLRPGADQDALDLATFGHEQALTRKFNVWSLLSLAVCILGTWSTLAQGLNSGFTNGGPITILWGLVLVLLCNMCVAVSLGELCSAMPTTLGQAYWVSRLWPTPLGRFVSYMCAWINTFGWWTLAASQNAFMTEFLLGMKLMFDPEWEGGGVGWIQFVVYLVVTLFMTVFNLVACRKDAILPVFNNTMGILFVGLFFIISMALLISVGTRPGLEFQPASFVFGTWINETGWSNGVTWFMGLVQGAYGLTAFDSAIHMVEEIPNPRKNVPLAIWLSVLTGAVTGFIFMVVCLFSVQDLDEVLNPVTQIPFMDLLWKTVGQEGSCVLLSLFILIGFGAGVSIVTTSSRLTWGFARDGGLPWSQNLAKVHDTWKVPLQATWLQGAIVGLVGVLYVFANTVLEAILSVSTIALTISYALPIFALLLAGRGKLSPGPFRLGVFGPVCNYVALIYCCITTVFFFFPGTPNPAPSDMNFAIAVFGVMVFFAVGFWFLKGHSTYILADGSGSDVLAAVGVDDINGPEAGKGALPVTKSYVDE